MGAIVVPQWFVDDLNAYLDDEGGNTEADKESVCEHFRAMLGDGRRKEALDWVKMKGDIIRGRNKNAKGITERIKSTITQAAAPGADANQQQGESACRTTL